MNQRQNDFSLRLKSYHHINYLLTVKWSCLFFHWHFNKVSHYQSDWLKSITDFTFESNFNSLEASEMHKWGKLPWPLKWGTKIRLSICLIWEQYLWRVYVSFRPLFDGGFHLNQTAFEDHIVNEEILTSRNHTKFDRYLPSKFPPSWLFTFQAQFYDLLCIYTPHKEFL